VSTFSVKDLRFTFTLSNNAVFRYPDNSNVLQVNGLRDTAVIKGSGLPAFPEAELTIYGLNQSDMNALTSLQFQPLAMSRNSVIVEADNGNGQGFSTVFAGQIITSGPDYAGIPHVPLKVQARILGFESLNPATPTSYTGATSVANIVQTIAAKLGYVLENNGVTAILNNPYFGGTLVDQLRAVKQAAGIQMFVEGNVIAICPPGVPRNQETFTIGPNAGLVGYPKLDFQRGFVRVKALYNPAFRFGGPINIEGSSVPLANGSWVIGTITHTLEAQTYNGQWFSDMLLYPPSAGIPPIS
jgi:hypothetical protein